MKLRNWAFLAIVALCTTVSADEPTARFLDALRKAGYHDAIGYYFDSLKSKKGTTPEFQQSIPFEQAVSFIRSSRKMQDAERKRATLLQAEKLLADFVKANPGHTKKNEAVFEQAAATRERGKVDLDTALNSSDGNRQKQLMESARPLFSRANKLFLSAKTMLQIELKAYPASIDRQKKPEQYDARESVRRKLHDAMYFEAVSLFDLAQTYTAKDRKFSQTMQSAADSFKNVAQLHRMTRNGFRSKFMQGRCYQKMGLFRLALPVYKELIDYKTKDSWVNNIRHEAKYYQLTIWNDDKQKDYKLSENAAAKWLNAPENQDDLRTPIGLKIRFQRAIAFEKRAREKKVQDRDKKQLLQQAQADAQLVSQLPNKHQNDAVMMVAQIKQRRGIASSDPKTFTDAYSQAKTRFQIVYGKISALENAQASGKKPQELQKLEADLKKNLEDSVRLFELAIDLSLKTSNPRQFDDVRYRLSYLYFYQQRYYEAAVLAEGVSLAMKKSIPTKAPDAAFIALSAFSRLYNEAKPKQRSFETVQVKRSANLILQNWPNSGRAGEAVALLAQIHENSGEPMEANEWFAKIPNTSGEFGVSQIRMGKNLLFFLYQIDNFSQSRTAQTEHFLKIKGKFLGELLIALKTIPVDAVEHKKSAELLKVLESKLKQTSDDAFPTLARTIQNLGLKIAQNYFEIGMKAITKDLADSDPTPPELLDAKTALAQLKLSQNQYEEAVKLLSKEPHSPLKAIEVPDESKRPDDNSVKGRKYAQSVYQLLIQAYISAEDTDNASKMLNKLEKLFESSDQAKLAEMFEGIARSLQQDIQRLKKQGDVNLLNSRVKTLEGFLNGLYEKRSTLSYSSLLWIATTFSGLGEGMGDAGTKYYARAADTYAELLKQPNLDDDRKLAVKLRLIDCRRLQKDFEGAIKNIGIILKDRPNLLIAQMSSAKIFEDWGKSGNPDAYLSAINGDEKNGIWGWAKVADRLQRKMSAENSTPEKYREYLQKFYDARYRIGWCRMEHGKALSPDVNNQRRRAVLVNAKTEIDSLALISGGLDSATKSRFNELYRQIQLAMGKPQTGLASVSWPSSMVSKVKNTQSKASQQKSKTLADSKTGQGSQGDSKTKESKTDSNLTTLLVIVILVAGGGLTVWFIFSLQRQEKKRRRMYASTNEADNTPFDFQAVIAARTKTASRSRQSQKVSSARKKQRRVSADSTSGQRTQVRKKPKDTGKG